MPIEIAALDGSREDVEILFPVTYCIPTVHDWSIDGIIHHAKSASMKQVFIGSCLFHISSSLNLASTLNS